MKNNRLIEYDFNNIYNEISGLITKKKDVVRNVINDTMVSLYWGIGECLNNEILKNEKPEYGKKLVAEISNRLAEEYGKGFNRASVFRMIQFFQLFSDYQKVATLSRQLTWSHFVELLSIEDNLGRSGTFRLTQKICHNRETRDLLSR